MGDDGLEELPPELAAAWRYAEARPAGADAQEASEHVPGVEPAPTRTKAPAGRPSPLLAFALLPVTIAAVVVVKVLGLAGWRGGALVVTAGLTVVAVAVGLVLTRRQPLRPLYLVGAVVVALVGSAWCVSTAPWSHGRLDEELDRMPTAVLVREGTTHAGHGWCLPVCPSVRRTYLLPGRQPITAARLAVAAAAAGRLIPQDAARTSLSRALGIVASGRTVVIDNQRYTTIIRAEAIGPDSRVTVVITSRKGLRRVPSAPCEEGHLVPRDVDLRSRGCPRG